ESRLTVNDGQESRQNRVPPRFDFDEIRMSELEKIRSSSPRSCHHGLFMPRYTRAAMIRDRKVIAPTTIRILIDKSFDYAISITILRPLYECMNTASP